MDIKKFIADLCNTIWKLMISVLLVGFLYAWITDTLVESDLMFGVYYLVVNAAFLVVELVMRKFQNGK